MHSLDQSQNLLEKFPELAPETTFAFGCHPKVRCFNACCSDLDLTLTPYDVLRLRRQLQLSSKNFLDRYGSLHYAPDTGVPAVQLRMLQNKDRSCPFVTPEGCKVYGDRPGACRTYPVGRATTLTEQGVQEKFFLIQENHCSGFQEPTTWTPHQWLADQGLARYNDSNDQYMRLRTLLRARAMHIPRKMMGMTVMALYHLDDFQDFLRNMNILSKLPLSPARAEDILHDEEKTLDFAFKWIDIIVLGFDPTTLENLN